MGLEMVELFSLLSNDNISPEGVDNSRPLEINGHSAAGLKLGLCLLYQKCGGSIFPSHILGWSFFLWRSLRNLF